MTKSGGFFSPEWMAQKVPHYYGDFVRVCFLIAGVLLLISIPIDRDLLEINLTVGVIGVLIITILAGYTNPKSRMSITADLVLAALVFIAYEYFAIAAYLKTENFADRIFLLRQAIALLSLLALYYSVKSLRGMSSLDELQ